MSEEKRIVYEILLQLDDKTLLQVMQTNQFFHSFVNDEKFWKARYIDKYGNDIKPDNITWKKHYLTQLIE